MDKLRGDVTELKQEFAAAMIKLSGMRDDMHGVREDTKDIKEVLTGKPLDKKDLGLLGRFHEYQTKVDKLEKFRDRVYVVLIVLSVLGGYGVSDLITKIFTK